ncbi:hypothetical protein K3495_g16988 [Podosphaera aphanis]|nr:hypothetical protein K3495_g16988 [Podosphaera aphanis]
MTVDESDEERKAYRKALKGAKKAFYLSKIETASTGKDVFAMTKWHKSSGSYRSSPLKDPRFPDKPLSTSIDEKREVLAGNLLANLAHVEDIPMDAPSVQVRNISFPPLTRHEIQESILKAGNKAPGSDEISTTILSEITLL